MKNQVIFFLTGIFVFTFLLIQGCKENKVSPPEMSEYIESILQERAEKDSSLQNDPHSPFNRDANAAFRPLEYYEPDPDFIFQSKLFDSSNKDTIAIIATRGEVRPSILIGYLELKRDGKVHKLNVYKSYNRHGEPYYSIWYTDRTTGNETYGVGRYLDFELNDDPDFIYTVDFNKAYNPYCAYSMQFSCPIPREEDHIDMTIEAGEKNFH
jgi:uncharacterized protein